MRQHSPRAVPLFLLTSFLMVACSAPATIAESMARGGGGPASRHSIVLSREGDLWLTDAAASAPTNLTNGIVEDVAYPQWNPDKSRIAFGCFYEDGANQEICTIRSDGTDFRRLTHHDGNDYGPDWSPNGKRIAFIRGGKHRVLIMNARGRREHAIGVQNVGHLGWRFRTRLMLSKGAVDGGDLFTVLPSGEGLRRVGPTEDGKEDEPQWSPNGRWIVFVRQVATRYEDVFKMRRNGSDVTRLTRDCCFKGNPSWSPSGKRILFGNQGLYIMDADGDNVEELDVPSGSADWS